MICTIKSKVAEPLARAGLQLIDLKAPKGTLPVHAAWQASSCGKEDGRRDHTVAIDDPDLIRKSNEGWFELANQGALFDENREFLLALNFEEILSAEADESIGDVGWVRVRLSDRWDIMGTGAATGLLGWGPGRPGFIMLALDGKVVLEGTTWNNSIGSLIVPNPGRAHAIRNYVILSATDPKTGERQRLEAIEWLRSNP